MPTQTYPSNPIQLGKNELQVRSKIRKRALDIIPNRLERQQIPRDSLFALFVV